MPLSFSCIICPALFWAFAIRLCLAGVCLPCMISHTPSIFMLSGFSGHVHVGQVYGFSRIPRCITKWANPGYFFRNMDIVPRNGVVVPNHFYVFLPSVWSGFFYGAFIRAFVLRALAGLFLLCHFTYPSAPHVVCCVDSVFLLCFAWGGGVSCGSGVVLSFPACSGWWGDGRSYSKFLYVGNGFFVVLFVLALIPAFLAP